MAIYTKIILALSLFNLIMENLEKYYLFTLLQVE